MRSGRRRKLEERVGYCNTLTPNDAHLGDIESVLFSGASHVGIQVRVDH